MQLGFSKLVLAESCTIIDIIGYTHEKFSEEREGFELQTFYIDRVMKLVIVDG